VFTRLGKDLHPLLAPLFILISLSIGLTALDFWLPPLGNNPIFQGYAILPQVRLFLWLGGVAFLAARLYGEEFRHQTLLLGLAQPLPRGQVWIHKYLVLIAAALLFSLICVATLAERFSTVPVSSSDLRLGGLFVLAVVCAAPYWAFVTRSTISTVVMVLAAPYALQMVGALAPALGLGASADSWFLALLGTYCVVTVIAGWRRLRDLQLAEPVLGESLFFRKRKSTPAQERTRPAILPRLLRPHPRTPGFNLVIKELQLQRTNVLLTGVFLASVVLLLVVGTITATKRETMELLSFVPFVAYMTALPLLAGSTPFAEEADLRIQESNRLHPVGRLSPWFARLLVSGGLFLVLGIVLPRLIVVTLWSNGYYAVSPLRDFLEIRGLRIMGGETVVALQVAAFLTAAWIASVVPSVARASLLTLVMVPVWMVIFSLVLSGYWMPPSFIDRAIVANWGLIEDKLSWFFGGLRGPLDWNGGFLLFILILMGATAGNFLRPPANPRSRLRQLVGIFTLVAALGALVCSIPSTPAREWNRILGSREQLQTQVEEAVQAALINSGEVTADGSLPEITWEQLVATGKLDSRFVELNADQGIQIFLNTEGILQGAQTEGIQARALPRTAAGEPGTNLLVEARFFPPLVSNLPGIGSSQLWPVGPLSSAQSTFASRRFSVSQATVWLELPAEP